MLAINQIKDASQSLRPKSEVEAQIAQMSINTIKEDPNQYYKIGKEIYSNVDSTVYMCSRKRDGKQFVMKITDKDSAVSEKAKISGEHQLLQIIDSDYVIKAEGIYEHNERLILLLEFMDGKELTKILTDYHKKYSEEFIKYTIWSAA